MNQSKKFLARLKRSKTTLEVVKFAVITFATLLKPDAILLVAVLELGFLFLELVQSAGDQ